MGSHASDIAQVAVGVVLFHAGLGTNWREFRGVLKPGLRLALVGSLITALLLMLAIHGLQNQSLVPMPHGWGPALFIGAMVCSTDASAKERRASIGKKGEVVGFKRKGGTSLEKQKNDCERLYGKAY